MEMFYLISCIISSSLIVIIFKYIERFHVNTFNSIIINYFTALFTGILLVPDLSFFSQITQKEWLYSAMVIGILFVAMFFVIARTSQKVGVSVAAIAGKMSVIFPMLFSILYYHESIGFVKILGSILAIIAVVLAISKNHTRKVHAQYFYLPIMLFIGSGIVDSLVKYSQEEYLQNDQVLSFSIVLFAISAFSSVTAKAITPQKLVSLFHWKTLTMGILLGVCNFGSLYFMIQALNSNVFDSSVVFAINHIGVVALSTFLAILLFKEKLSTLNWVGVIISFVAIYILFNV